MNKQVGTAWRRGWLPGMCALLLCGCGGLPTLETRTASQALGEEESAGTALGRALAPELAAIVAICAEPVSVAEISARTRMHFGVTRVLVGDLRAAGHLDVHVADVDDALDPDIILRVIDGLRAIS